jgi:hypothetical protein
MTTSAAGDGESRRANTRRIRRGSFAISRSSGCASAGRKIPATIFRLLSSRAI